jgi:hypothetical protein
MGNLSLVYKDNVRVEGMGGMPLVYPTDWYPQIQCFSEDGYTPLKGKSLPAVILFRWPAKGTGRCIL